VVADPSARTAARIAADNQILRPKKRNNKVCIGRPTARAIAEV